jgi:catechol 2,3-dioxygenase-like lactoylglutathione lyase family enzyme
MAVKLNRIQHIGIPVTNVDASEVFYRRLGFVNSMTSGFDYQGGRGKCVMMQRDSMILELYQMPDAELAAIRGRRDGHVDHVAFDVDDIDATFAQLKAEGFTPVEEKPVLLPFWKNGCKYFFILGPDGERLEFNQIL